MNQAKARHNHQPQPPPLAVPVLERICLTLFLALAGCNSSGGDGVVAEFRIPSPLPIEVVGDDYYWFVRYPGADGQLHTQDDVEDTTNLHLPVATETHIKITSRDYLYTFGLPSLGISQVAVPDLMFGLEFTMNSVGTYELEGDQLCGFSHESLMGEIIVQSREDFINWLRSQRALGESAWERGI